MVFGVSDKMVIVGWVFIGVLVLIFVVDIFMFFMIRYFVIKILVGSMNFINFIIVDLGLGVCYRV